MRAARTLMATALLGGAVVLGGCAPPPSYYGPTSYAPRVEYGVVESIDFYRGGAAPPSGAGAVIGGIAGGLVGHQFGAGSGNTAATIAGAVGGAVVGNEVERQNNVRPGGARIAVRTDNGALVALNAPSDLNLRVGDRVRLENGRIYRM